MTEMGTVSGAALVGRADELHRLSACCRAVKQGAGALVLLDGDAGTGKTRLLAEILSPAFLPKGYASAVAGALDYARAPYSPIRDLLLLLDKRFPKVLASNALLTADLQPVLEFRPAPEEAGDAGRQRRVLDAVVRAVELYAAQSPVVLALEDAHWIDSASADVLAHLARAIPAMRALLVVSFRPAEAREDERAQHLISQLSRGAALSLSLRPLPGSDALMLVDEIAGPALSMELRRSVCRMAEGNPLLLIEFAKVAIENPDALEGPLPISLKALVAERLARFDALDVDVLRVAAVMGEFDPRVLVEIAGIDDARVAATLRKARDASIIGEQRSKGAPFIFRHALIRHAIIDELLGFERERLHLRIAERLERDERGEHANSQLAHHYYLAGAREKARHYNELAGREAMAVYAYSDAAQFFERAIDGRSLSEETFELHTRLADAYSSAQRPADALRVTEQLFDFALQGGDHVQIAGLGFELSRRRYRLLDDTGSLAAVERAIAAVDERRFPAEAFNLRATLGWYLAHLRRTEDAARELAHARRLLESAEPAALVRYHEAFAAYNVHTNQIEAYREHVVAGLDIVRGGDPLALARALDNAIGISMASNLEDIDFALRCCEELWEIARGIPVQALANTLAMTAWIAYLHGDLARSREVLAACFPAAEEAPMVSFNVARVGIPLALRLDEPLLLRRSSRPRLLERAFASTSANVFGPIAAAVAAQMHAEGRTSEAATLVAQAIKRLDDGGNNVPLLILASRLNAGEARASALELLAAMTRSKSAQAGWHLSQAYVSTANARQEHAMRAAELFAQIPWPLYEAEALEAADENERALQIYRQCGAVADVRRLESDETRRTNNALSKREWEVAKLVAAGKSNRSIADDLSLSERTVENHISSIFGKLNMRSRAEVASHIAREAARAD